MELHLLLVNFPFVEDLVDQQHQALCITVNGVEVGFAFFVVDRILELCQRTQDQCERGTDVVGGVHKELHLLVV